MQVKITNADGGFQTIDVKDFSAALDWVSRRMKNGYGYGGKVTFEIIGLSLPTEQVDN